MNNRPLTTIQNEVLLMITERPKSHPITSYELMTFLEIKDSNRKTGANLRSVINTLRDKGYPICANGDGYYYPQSPEELLEYIESFQRRIDQQQEACNVLKMRHQSWNESRVPPGPVQDKLII